MQFRLSTDVWAEFPELVPGVLSADGTSASGFETAILTRSSPRFET